MSNEVNWALNELGDKSQDVYNRIGLWPGRVEDIDDPQRLGRIRVRIFHLHGDKRSTPTNALPWCKVLSLGGGGYDYGSGGRQYIVGSTVMVAFEQGDERSPIVIGGVHGSPLRDSRNPDGSPRQNAKNPVEFLTVDGQSYNKVEKSWLPKEGNEIPQDVFGDSASEDTHPTRTVWKKSYKGHTILCEDRDGFEFIRIIDRAGQVVEMNCPVTKSANSNNAQQRGHRNAINDTQLAQSNLVNGRAYIRLKDVAGQEIILDGKQNGEEIRLVSRNRQGSTFQKLTVSSAKGREKLEMIDKSGNMIVIDPNSEKTIRVYDITGNEIAFSSEEKYAQYTASVDARETVGRSKTVNISGKLQETIGGDRDSSVLGNEFLSVLNDLSANISGMTSAFLSGALQVQVVNAPADGTPKTVGMDVNVAAGDARLKTEIGAAELETTLGNINLVTTNPLSTINMGSRVPIDSATLESKVQTELERIRQDIAKLRDETGRSRSPVTEFLFPLIFVDIVETFAQPLLYTIPGEKPINIRSANQATANNAPMDTTSDPGKYILDIASIPPGQSGVYTAPTNPSPTLSDRVKIDQ